MIHQRKPLPKRRARPRRERPELFFKPEREETWEEISLRNRLKWWKAKPVYCGICWFRVIEFEDLVPDHIEPGKMGGCKNNADWNLQPAHVLCNNLKGSKRNYSREDCLRDLGIYSTQKSLAQ